MKWTRFAFGRGTVTAVDVVHRKGQFEWGSMVTHVTSERTLRLRIKMSRCMNTHVLSRTYVYRQAFYAITLLRIKNLYKNQ